MKNSYKYIATAILALVMFSQANATDIIKKIEKSFTVNKGDQLDVDHSFGELRLKTWDRSRIDVVITIEADGYDKSKYDDIIRSIELTMPEQGDQDLTFRTRYNSKKYIDGNKNKIRVNYLLMIPKSLDMEISHSFGDLIIDDHAGRFDIEIEYGKITASALKGDGDLEVNYSKGSIRELGKSDIDIGYSEVSIDRIGSSELKAQYSSCKVMEAASLETSVRYGSLYLGKVVELAADVQYAGLTVDYLQKNLELDGKYCSGKIKINNIQKDFDRIMVDMSYGGAVLRFAEAWDACYTAEESYGSIDLDKNFKNRIENTDDFSSYYKGYLGKENGNCPREIKAEVKYGTIQMEVAN
jgi:hypothetical protein